MRTSEVADFINKNKVRARLVLPAIGSAGNAYGVFHAKADGGKLAWVGAGDPESGAPYHVFGSFVHEIIPGKDKIRVRVDEAFPEQAIDFEKIPEGDAHALTDYLAGHNVFDDTNDGLAAQIEETFQNTRDPGEPQLLKHYRFVRWSAWTPEGQEPRGVILIAPNKNFYALAFPGFESEASYWNRFQNVPDDALDRLPTIAGRTAFLSIPETIHAEGWEDAPLRALHKFGADFFAETGRTLFQ